MAGRERPVLRPMARGGVWTGAHGWPVVGQHANGVVVRPRTIHWCVDVGGTAHHRERETNVIRSTAVMLGAICLCGGGTPNGPVATVEQPAQRSVQMQLTTPPTPPTTTTLPAVPSWPWDALAQCESGGNWSINTGNGYYGGLQFALTSWRAVGGTGYPHQHSREEQIRRGIALQRIQGWGAWPACARKLGLR